jgi:hypothetical protein
MEGFHPYKLQFVHRLTVNDLLLRMEFCEMFMDMCNANPNLLVNICWTDESTFFLNGRMNHHNIRYYSRINPHWVSETKCQNSPKVNVWAGIFGDHLVGPFFIEGNITGDKYLDMLKNEVLPALARLPGGQNAYWMQDGAPAHFKRNVRDYLNALFPNRWIGRSGPIPWPARSPDLTPMDFFFWGYVKHQVFLTQPTDVDDLKDRITRACQSVPIHMFQNSRRATYDRLGYCLVQDGHQFEHLI